MKSQQFDSFNAAIDYLSSKGKLSYQGRIGHHAEICLYLYEREGYRYTLYVYLDGKVEVRK